MPQGKQLPQGAAATRPGHSGHESKGETEEDHHGREAAGSSSVNECPQRDSNPRYHLERVAT
jgi:hypothetical protein